MVLRKMREGFTKSGFFKKRKNKTAPRLGQILTYMEGNQRAVGMPELIETTGIPKSSCYEIIDRLIDRDKYRPNKLLITFDHSGERIPVKFGLTAYGKAVANRISKYSK